jgi:hypothetical protein
MVSEFRQTLHHLFIVWDSAANTLVFSEAQFIALGGCIDR